MQTHAGRNVEHVLKLPEKVVQDTLAYRGQVGRFVSGELSAVAFRAQRVPMGIYEQRRSGTYMVRVRIGAGIASSAQLRRIAELSRRYGSGAVHVTTRQDMQLHDVKIEQTPEVLESLLEVGLSSRGGGGNTVRNVTACPRAGLCPFEQFDVTGHAQALAQYLLRSESSYNLPRKFKVAFSGCSDDCALASVADLGFFAHRRDGVRGFAAYAGGGLGPNAAVAVKIEDFVIEHEIFEVGQAVKNLFDRYGDRSNRHRARLRYVLARFGQEEFVRLYRTERERVRRQGLDGDAPLVGDDDGHPAGKAQPGDKAAATDLLPEKDKGLYSVRVSLSLGDVLADDLTRIAEIAETYGLGIVRATQQQDLLIPSVPKENVSAVREALQGLSLRASAAGGPKVVACAGASTCRLGLCLSRGLARAIEDTLAQSSLPGKAGPTIHISGCPNSCGQHLIGGLGLQGRARRVHGRLMPCYEVFVGARVAEGAARLAQPIGIVPARRAPDFIAEALNGDGLDHDRLVGLVAKYADTTGEVPEDYYIDWGSHEPFSLTGRGPGECGAGILDVVKVDIDAAAAAVRRASSLASDPEQSQAAYQALLTSARALLILFAEEPKSDRQVFEAFGRRLIEPGWVEPAARGLLDGAIDWRLGDRPTLADTLPDICGLVDRVEKLFLSLNGNLQFQLAPIRPAEPPCRPEEAIRQVDLRGVPCPLNFVKAKIALEKADIGEALEIELDDGEPVQNVPASLAGQGHEVVDVRNLGTHHLLKVVRRR